MWSRIVLIATALAACFDAVRSTDTTWQQEILNQVSFYPSTGNLLIGREANLTATSTCGIYGPKLFCIASDKYAKQCFWCDSQPGTEKMPDSSHGISNIVYKYFPGTMQKSWWQSENGKEVVSIKLDLEAEFLLTHLIIEFKSVRPAAMLVERSRDFGKTWQVYRYFAHNCTENFPCVPMAPPKTLTEAVCESRYSDEDPSSGGEVGFKVIHSKFDIENPFSPEVLSLQTITNLRINFTKFHTLSDDLLLPENPEKYYYAITSMIVRGSCLCYGHASRCLPPPGVEPKSRMVGKCECLHHTAGLNCEYCEDLYNDSPWEPASGNTWNGCKKCKCNNHAGSCHFDAAVFNFTGQQSGGVCDDCQHNTMGRNCELCKPSYYRDPKLDLSHPDGCKACNCDTLEFDYNGNCDPYTDESKGLVAGKCHCNNNYFFENCVRPTM